jgi:hypothetical protein
VWSNFAPASSNSDILYKKSTNGGASFSGTVKLTNTDRSSTRPAIAASNNLT